jgi:phage replication O-like protein O
MANPQPDKYTMVANELMEQVPNFKLNGTQLRIILIIWRYTYGFGRKDHIFSLTFLSKALGAHKNLISREVQYLIEKRVLKLISEETYTESRKLRFNKDYDAWLIKRGSTKKVTPPVNQLGDTQSTNCGTPPVTQLGDQERKRSLKKIFKEIYSLEVEEMLLSKLKKMINSIYSHWTSCNLTKHRALNPQIELQIKWKLENYSVEELNQSISTYSEILNNPEYVLTTKWGLDDFLGKGHFEKFMPDRDPYTFYPKINGFIATPKKTKFDKDKEDLQRMYKEAEDRERNGNSKALRLD